VNAVNEIDGVHLVIRLHPGREISPSEIKSLLPSSDKLTITPYKRPFFEILTITDLMVNYSSTVIEDALQSYMPVLLYDKRKRYMHYEAEKLDFDSTPNVNSVYYVNDSNNLKKGIQWILKNHLEKKVPKSVFYKNVFSEQYYDNLLDFALEKLDGECDIYG
jgi:hypothetical protein